MGKKINHCLMKAGIFGARRYFQDLGATEIRKRIGLREEKKTAQPARAAEARPLPHVLCQPDAESPGHGRTIRFAHVQATYLPAKAEASPLGGEGGGLFTCTAEEQRAKLTAETGWPSPGPPNLPRGPARTVEGLVKFRVVSADDDSNPDPLYNPTAQYPHFGGERHEPRGVR